MKPPRKPPRSVLLYFPDVTTCTDAKAPVEITVKPGDAKRAQAAGADADPARCAMATAICREWKADAALVGATYSYVVRGNTAVRFATPETVRREILSFDRKAGFKPGKYHLAKIPRSQRREAKGAGGRKKPGKSHGPKRRIFHAETLGLRKMR